ncbi:MAG: Hsp20/alpha crystallin family protein [Taibaiella sp.]|jgi:hypothetical protein
MPFLKPFRICNDLQIKPLAILQQEQCIHQSAFLKDLADAYELRLHLSDIKTASFSVFIQDYILNIDMIKHAGNLEIEERETILRMFLPADVKQDMVRAFLRPYGIKVILPKKVIREKGRRIEVPINC